MQPPVRDTGSFRDPSGYVFRQDDRVLRAVTSQAADKFHQTYESGILGKLAQKGLLIETSLVEADDALLAQFKGAREDQAAALYEHPLVPFLTYPYEWCFSQLQDAALAHLDLQLAALAEGYELSDATAYNMQFVNGRPIQDREGLSDGVAPDDEIYVMQALSGG